MRVCSNSSDVVSVLLVRLHVRLGLGCKRGGVTYLTGVVLTHHTHSLPSPKA